MVIEVRLVERKKKIKIVSGEGWGLWDGAPFSVKRGYLW
jgi:hypothetical protein